MVVIVELEKEPHRSAKGFQRMFPREADPGMAKGARHWAQGKKENDISKPCPVQHAIRDVSRRNPVFIQDPTRYNEEKNTLLPQGSRLQMKSR
jgi:hypothetical protein